MKKAGKWIAGILLVVVILLTIGFLLFNEPIPEGKNGEKAELLADKMLEAINFKAWDTTRYVSWTFQGNRHFVWDKDKDLVEVKWNSSRVILETTTQNGLAWANGLPVDGSKKDNLLSKAWEMFCNDSFWLNAPAKVRDPGTERTVVEHDGKPALKVSYTSGGVTPGDTYLWILDDNGLPVSWKMWVSIIPVGGVEATWEDWIELKTGALISTTHNISGYQSKISNVYGSSNHEHLNIDYYPFEEWYNSN